MYPITLFYPDCDTAEPGTLYPAGCPVTVWGDEVCPLCDQPVTTQGVDLTTGAPRVVTPEAIAAGTHLGLILTGKGRNDEVLHMRCVLDVAEVGSIGLTLGSTDLGSTGRHAA